ALDAVVLRLQPRIDPEALDADDLLLLVAHRAGHIHHVDDDGVRLRQRLAAPAPVTLVLADRNDHRILRVVRAHRDLTAHRLAVRAAEMAQRLGTGRADARVL